jgi:mannose-1-phosphate guanylyltransferase
VLLENDPVSFRGTAGVLRDVASAYQDHDNLLAIAGAQIPLVPLDRVFAMMAEARGDMTLLANPDQSPAELLLFSARTMRGVSTKGYVDLKEQALPRIARDHQVMVARLPRPAGAPIRSRRQYIWALRHYHRASRAVWMDPHEQQCFSSFAIREAGSRVSDTAVLHDSVVLDGGIVESGAVVVRSVVCAGGRVQAGQTVVDVTVCARGLDPA